MAESKELKIMSKFELWKAISDTKISFLRDDSSNQLKFTGQSVKKQLEDAIQNYKGGNLFIDLFPAEELKHINHADVTVKYNLLVLELEKIIPKETLKFSQHEEKNDGNITRYKLELDEESTKVFIERMGLESVIKGPQNW